MDQEALLKEMEAKWKSLTEEDMKKVREIATEAGINEDLHLLLLGRPGVGKSTFAGELSGGKFKGSSGPAGGTKSSDEPGKWRHIKMAKMEEENSTKLDGSDTKKAYFVYDTVGLGDVKVDRDEMKGEAKEVCQQSGHCTVFLCIGWEDRIDSNDTHIAFDVCDSLGMWKNVVVLVTKCDLVSPEYNKIVGEWKQCIAEKLESMNVEGSEIAKITKNIVFYPKNEIKPVDQGTWANTLMQRLMDTIQSEKRLGNTAVPALSNGVSLLFNFLSHTKNAVGLNSCFQSSGNYKLQICAGPNQNTDGSFSQKSPQDGPQQSLEKKGLSGQARGGMVGGFTVAGAIAGGVLGAGIGAAGGAAVGAGIGGIILALIAYFYF